MVGNSFFLKLHFWEKLQNTICFRSPQTLQKEGFQQAQGKTQNGNFGLKGVFWEGSSKGFLLLSVIHKSCVLVKTLFLFFSKQSFAEKNSVSWKTEMYQKLGVVWQHAKRCIFSVCFVLCFFLFVCVIFWGGGKKPPKGYFPVIFEAFSSVFFFLPFPSLTFFFQTQLALIVGRFFLFCCLFSCCHVFCFCFLFVGFIFGMLFFCYCFLLLLFCFCFVSCFAFRIWKHCFPCDSSVSLSYVGEKVVCFYVFCFRSCLFLVLFVCSLNNEVVLLYLCVVCFLLCNKTRWFSFLHLAVLFFFCCFVLNCCLFSFLSKKQKQTQQKPPKPKKQKNTPMFFS